MMSSRKLKSSAITMGAATFLQIDTQGGEFIFNIYLASSLISLLSRLCQLSWRNRANFFLSGVNAVKWY
jgi:hypothetical protein